MGFELAPGTLLNNRYQIKKVLTFSENGGVYVARDLKVTDRNWIVKEIIPSERLDEAELAERRKQFLRAIESAMQFEHAGLIRIFDHFSESRREYVLMEQADGVTLHSLCEMTVNPLPEKQVLGWALQICDALAYCHNRPTPFIFSAISPNHIILTSDEKIKLINFGLDRYFSPDTPLESLTDAPSEVPREYQRFGETLAFLLTNEKASAKGLGTGTNVSAKLTQVVNRCLQPQGKAPYAGFEELKQELDLILHPPAAPPTTEMRVARTKGASVPITERLLDLLSVVLSQRRPILYAEIAVALVLVLGLFFWSHPVYHYSKSGATGYVATGDNGLVSFQVATGKVVDQKRMDSAVGDLLVEPSGNVLLVALQGSSKLLRLDVGTNQPLPKGAFVPVDQGPSRMVADPTGRTLYVLHDARSNISRVNLASDPPQTESVIAVGRSPRDIAVSRDGRQLYVANGQERSVSVIEAATGRIAGSVTLTGVPVALAPVQKGNAVWVACQSPDLICAVDFDTSTVTTTLDEIGGNKPASVLLSPERNRLYVANEGSANVSVFQTIEPKLLRTITVLQRPRRIIAVPEDRMWAICADGVAVIDPIRETVTDQVKIPGRPFGPATIAP